MVNDQFFIKTVKDFYSQEVKGSKRFLLLVCFRFLLKKLAGGGLYLSGHAQFYFHIISCILWAIDLNYLLYSFILFLYSIYFFQ